MKPRSFTLMSCPGLTVALGSALGGVVVMVNLPIKAVTAFPPGCQPRL
jgi:hypothetical protein